jgi:hypothetical protein
VQLAEQSWVSVAIVGAIGLGLGIGFAAGAWQGVRNGETNARVRFEKEMREACVTWFTDSRAKKPIGRIVVCTAPQFMLQK